MPDGDNRVERRATFQLLLLLLALPAQYLIVNYSSVNPQQSQRALKDFIAQAQQMGTGLLSWPAWQKWCVGVIHKLSNTYGTASKWRSRASAKGNTGESPAMEVMRHGDPNGYFTNAVAIRSPRPKEVIYRVGQVVTHNRWGYRGIIIGWDTQARAPEEWLAANHPKGMERWRSQPNYAILVDTRDRAQPQITYVPQENIRLSDKTRVIHPSINDYFDSYDGAHYIARPALKELYPDD